MDKREKTTVDPLANSGSHAANDVMSLGVRWCSNGLYTDAARILDLVGLMMSEVKAASYCWYTLCMVHYFS